MQLDSGSRAAAQTPAERYGHVTRCERAIRTTSGRRVVAHLHVRSGGCARCTPCARRSPRLQTGASHLAGPLLQLTVRTAGTLDPSEVRSPPDQSNRHIVPVKNRHTRGGSAHEAPAALAQRHCCTHHRSHNICLPACSLSALLVHCTKWEHPRRHRHHRRRRARTSAASPRRRRRPTTAAPTAGLLWTRRQAA